MNETDALVQRHSVRSYLEKPIEPEKTDILQTLIDEINRTSGLHIQLILQEPQAFSAGIAHYGSFTGVRNYIVLAGRKQKDLDELCGYYGEKIVLRAQMLGLNTCWVGMPLYRRHARFSRAADEKVTAVIALGYGKDSGHPHCSKPFSEVSEVHGSLPDWYLRGMEAVLLAPTAMNQQKFRFSCTGNTVSAKAERGLFAKLDLGIVRYHFEIAAGKENFVWAE